MFDSLKKKLKKFSQVFSKKVEEKEKSRVKEGTAKKEKAKAKVSTKVKKAVIGRIQLSDKDIDSFLQDFELELLEADVALESAERIIQKIGKKLKETEFRRGENIEAKVYTIFKEAIAEILDDNKPFDIPDAISERPYKILVMGPNGVGKTTTIAKLVFYLKQRGFSSVIAASDTFRAASIEQLSYHAEKLGVKLIKHSYGADPTAVAYDAINYAKAHNIDIVFIDTAGRQETNQNLIREIEKMKRVIKPNLKLFIAEAVVGNAILEQIRNYKEKIGIDAVVLTKIDLDTKGGSILSIIDNKIPVIYFGTGQSYEDLMPFDKSFVLKKIFES
ncbi:signal recognition particle-docking protein FtsY [Candidatus Micrarchaeota archaeon]|nr:MAG: signal recognition particle-docking protein FtsY [Candidatus Micrarchaeota archaeon]